MDPLDASSSSADMGDKKSRRREQNRLSAQRSYHKKQERLQSLRCQVSQLEAQYQQRVTTLPNSSTTDTSTVTPPPGSHARAASPVGSPSPSSPLQSLLADRAQLQSENEALRRRVDEQTRFQFRLQALSVSDEGDKSSGVTVVHNRVTGSPRFVPRITMKRPLSVEECYSIGSHAYQRIRRYKFPDQAATIHGAPMFGWANKRVMEDGLMKVELRKTFARHAASDVARVSWAAVQDPRKMDALYSINMNMHSEITQRIDDNNVVMYQSYETPERDAQGHETGAVCVMHHVMLLSFFETETGFIIVFGSLDPDRLDDSDHIVDLAEEEDAVARGVVKRRRKLWFKKFSWLAMDHADGGASTEVTYLFTVPGHHGATFYWPLEILLLILRYEMAAVGPTILLPPSEDSGQLKGEEEEEEDQVMMDEKEVKIEPLTFVGDRLSSSVDDMDTLLVELFP